MKRCLVILFVAICLISCDKLNQEKPYSMWWQDNILIVKMPHPTLGISGRNEEDWQGVELGQVAQDILDECNNTQLSGDVTIVVRYISHVNDKYGNTTEAYNDYTITTMPLSEVRKYKSGKFLDNEYHLVEGFRNAAFGAKK